MTFNNRAAVLLAFTVLISCFASSSSTEVQGEGSPFDINMMYSKLMYSYAAYCPDEKVIAWQCKWCQYNGTIVDGFVTDRLLYNGSDNTLGYIGYQGDIGIVAFRGTEPSSLKNWISDLDALHTKPYPPVPNAFVHVGFLDAWYAAKGQAIAAIKNVTATTNISVWHFTGHSLGAAIAELSALDLVLEDLITAPILMYNFGAPRVGNQAFVDYYEKTIPTTYRATNRNDIVPHLPTQSMGFRHPVTEVWWDTATTYRICNETNGEDPTCSNSQTDLSIYDHVDYLDTYLGMFNQC